MYLKSIKAHGFKSFADKIEFNLCKDINCIVGPNGSGKSNVVDAIRWVLGEQSIKTLRGDSSIDVIFSGSKSRRALNSASITLTFDNSDLYLPINYTEVSIKRVMYRSGENEYFINNEKCRLKDINNLMADSGADKMSFNIIGQGKIEEILSTKPTDRRMIFESAAGVVKYKKRKEEAVKKLARTNDNLARVNDIIKEIEANLEPLERQSKSATEFLKLKDELANWDISLMVHDIREYNFKVKNLENDINKIKDEIVILSNAHSSYDVDLLNKKNELKKVEDNITEEQNNLLSLTKEISKINENINILKTKEEYSQNSNDIQDKIISLKENILKKEVEIKEIESLISLKKDELENLNNNKNITLNKYNKVKETKQQSIKKLEEFERELTNINYKIEFLENSINNGNSLPTSIKNILNHPNHEGVHNVIGALIDLDEEYSTAISISLGGASNYLVVDDSNTAKKWIKYLRDNNLGRATFYPIDTIKPRNIDEYTVNIIKNYSGFINIASELVSCDNIYQNIIDNQLGNIIIVDNIDNANNISKSINAKYKIVTLDGQMVNVGGSLTGGSVKLTSNILKERKELEDKKLDLISTKKRIEDTNQNINVFSEEINKLDTSLSEYNHNLQILNNEISDKNNLLTTKKEEHQKLSRDILDLEVVSNNNTESEIDRLLNLYYSKLKDEGTLKNKLEQLKNKKNKLNNDINELDSLSREDNSHLLRKEKSLKDLEISLSKDSMKLDNLLLTLTEEYSITYEKASYEYSDELDIETTRQKVTELKQRIKAIGYVNVDAIEEYKRVSERYNFLDSQRNDLKEAEKTLLEIINEMDTIMKEKFKTTFEDVRSEFKRVFREMFRGGEAELILTDPDNLLETGIEIEAVPSGKNLKSISLLSGGEKTFTAISLLFAILNVRPVPFCILDEVEAALDDANALSFGNYLYKYRNKTQFILITHKKKTMEFADILYGITMQESGVSKLVSVKLDNYEI